MSDHFIQAPLPCDVHVVSLRTLEASDTSPRDEVALMLHRKGFVCGYKIPNLGCESGGKVHLGKSFPTLKLSNLKVSMVHIVVTDTCRKNH